MTRLGRTVPSVLLLAVAVGCSGCGEHGGALPRHGVVFAHTGHPVGGRLDGGGDLYLWRPGERPRRLTSSPDPQGEPAWSPNGKQLAFAMTMCNGNADCVGRPGEVFVARSDGSQRRELTSSASGELRTEYPSWSPDGRRIAALRELNDYSRVVIVAVASGKTRPLHVRGTIDDPAWGRAGIAYLNRTHRSSSAPFAIRIADPRTGRARPFASPPTGYSVRSIAWSKRGELAALDGSLGHEYGLAQRVVIYSGAGRRVSQLEVPVRWSACGLTWSPRGSRLLLTVYRRAHFGRKTGQPSPRLYSVDPSAEHWQRLRLGLGLTSCSVSWR